MINSPLKRTGAFTLLEIMVALAILGLLVAAIYSSWMAIVRGSETAKRVTARIQRSRVAVRTLEEALTGARSFATDIESYAFLAENGDDAFLSFVAKLPESFPRSGRFEPFDVRRVTFALEPGPDGKELVLRQAPVLMDMETDEKEHPVVLAREVQEFEMGFWDRRSQDWLQEWTQTNQLPPMIRITLRTGRQRSEAGQEINRIVALPSITVQPSWQVPGSRPGAR